MLELRSCPFCGKGGQGVYLIDPEAGSFRADVRCECGAQMEGVDCATPDAARVEAIREWNSRAALTPGRGADESGEAGDDED